MKNSYLHKKYKQYLSSSTLTLSQCYKEWSIEKDIAWSYCKYLLEKYGGWNLKVISYNRYNFTAGFLYMSNSELKFMYITKNFQRNLNLDLVN